MATSTKTETVEVLPFLHLYAPAMREARRVGDFYIVISEVSRAERFFIAETVKNDCFGATVQVCSRPFKTFRDAFRVVNSSARFLKREIRTAERMDMRPSALRTTLRAIVDHQTVFVKRALEATR